MPSQQEVRWSQLKVGVIVLVAVVVLTTLLFLMTSSSGLGFFSHRLTVHTYFENAAGLKVGASVNLQGVTIGTVKAVTVAADPARKLTPVEVFMKIDSRYQRLLHTDSKVTLATQGMLGDTLVDINSQYATGPELQDGAELQTLETPSLNDVVKASKGTIQSVNQILAKVNTLVDGLQKGQGTAGKLLTDQKLYSDTDATVTQLRTLTTNLNQGRGTVGKLLTDDSLYRRLDATVAKFQNIADSLDAGQGTAGKLLKDETLYNNLNATLAHANSIMADADAGKGALGMILKDPKFRGQLSDTLNQADVLLAGVNNGKGTLGKLATDDQAYGNLNQLLTSSTDLVTAIRKDPKKYLTIHMKIF
jgi:phospholipid/cholesterol/gamma-HCH transport system substrate-binding protein